MEQFTTQWDTFVKSAQASGKALEALNLKLAESFGKQQSDLFAAAFETGNKWVGNLTEFKALPELLAAQGKLASEFGTKVMDLTREASALLNASRDEYKAWFEQGFKGFPTFQFQGFPGFPGGLEAAAKPAARKAA